MLDWLAYDSVVHCILSALGLLWPFFTSVTPLTAVTGRIGTVPSMLRYLKGRSKLCQVVTYDYFFKPQVRNIRRRMESGSPQ